MLRSIDISRLLKREANAWKVIDQCLGNKKGIPAKVRLSAAQFVLERIYPAKIEQETKFPETLRIVIDGLQTHELPEPFRIKRETVSSVRGSRRNGKDSLRHSTNGAAHGGEPE